jgi:hypothetical protein
MDDGREMPIETVVKGGTPNVQRRVAGGTAKKRPADGETADDHSLASRAREEVRQRASDAVASAKEQTSDALAAIKRPDKMSRLKDFVIARLPYHPQYLALGLVYDVELRSALSFGPATPGPPARRLRPTAS